MKMLRLSWVMGLFTSLAMWAAPSPIYENYGAVTNVPQIDALAFANYGQFGVGSLLPYETQNTLYFTNKGIMQGNPGFRLEHVTDNGVRGPANVFFNDNGAAIRASESIFIAGCG